MLVSDLLGRSSVQVSHPSDECYNQESAGTSRLESSLEAVLFATVCLGIHQSRDCIGTGLPGESSKHQTTTFLSLLPNEYLRYDSDDSHRKAHEKINSVFIAGFE